VRHEGEHVDAGDDARAAALNDVLGGAVVASFWHALRSRWQGSAIVVASSWTSEDFFCAVRLRSKDKNEDFFR
jgi:hypothetical protein